MDISLANIIYFPYFYVKLCYNPLPDYRLLVFTQVKAFSDNNFIVTQMLQFLFDRVESIVGKG